MTEGVRRRNRASKMMNRREMVVIATVYEFEYWFGIDTFGELN